MVDGSSNSPSLPTPLFVGSRRLFQKEKAYGVRDELIADDPFTFISLLLMESHLYLLYVDIKGMFIGLLFCRRFDFVGFLIVSEFPTGRMRERLERNSGNLLEWNLCYKFKWEQKCWPFSFN